ncbi:hypothetical protein [Sporisorium scitamineum]|uniref:Endonuclease/exonuclease/phosphatase domain-containing protein n=1 Tax=Sporisorium scitamineum TaxID=49012 RepID=A0A0F7S7M1_9BASI|nr:hypothetical protein [Sporisorium scitamineum]
MPPTRNRNAATPNPANESQLDRASRELAKSTEPAQDGIVPIYTGRHLWSGTRPPAPDQISPPLVAYEELPFPNSDRSKLPPSGLQRTRCLGRPDLLRRRPDSSSRHQSHGRAGLHYRRRRRWRRPQQGPRHSWLHQDWRCRVRTGLRRAPALVHHLPKRCYHVPPFQPLSSSLWLSNKLKRNGAARTTSTMAPPTKLASLSSSIAIVTWNCASLNYDDRIAALHDRSTALGKADIVFLQEMRLASPAALPQRNPFTALHHPVQTRAHQAVLGQDAGILLRNTRWQIEARDVQEYFTYARIRIPDSEPALGNHIRLLHLWSIHVPSSVDSQRAFWNADAPQLSRLDVSTLDSSTTAIVGADWNAVSSLVLDVYPSTVTAMKVPSGLLHQAGLVDVFRTLHPTATGFTRFHKVKNQIISARHLDGISITHNLVPHLNSIDTRPSLSDHSVVSVHLGTNRPRSDLGMGTWRIHRDAHRLPGFKLRIQQFAAQQPANVNHSPVASYFTFVERLRAAAATISASLSQRRQKEEAQRHLTLRQLSSLDIRHGDDTRAQFLHLLDRLRHLDAAISQTAVSQYRNLHEANMYRPTAWIIPRLESRSFAATPDLMDDQGTHSIIAAKLVAIHRFYTTLFTPKPRDRLSEEAGTILLGSINRRIKPATCHSLEAPFTVEEL